MFAQVVTLGPVHFGVQQVRWSADGAGGEHLIVMEGVRRRLLLEGHGGRNGALASPLAGQGHPQAVANRTPVDSPASLVTKRAGPVPKRGRTSAKLRAHFPDEVRRGEVVVWRPPVEAGEEAQVDYGYMGTWAGPASGRRRRIWAFYMVLTYSRHVFV